MFARKQEGSGSYECAQPNLRIQSGGSIVIDGRIHTIQAGSLWLDRQMVDSGGVGVGDAAAAPQNAEDLKQHLMKTALPRNRSIAVTDGHRAYENRVLVSLSYGRTDVPQGSRNEAGPPQGTASVISFRSTGTNPPMTAVEIAARLWDGGDDWDLTSTSSTRQCGASPSWQSKISAKTTLRPGDRFPRGRRLRLRRPGKARGQRQLRSTRTDGASRVFEGAHCYARQRAHHAVGERLRGANGIRLIGIKR